MDSVFLSHHICDDGGRRRVVLYAGGDGMSGERAARGKRQENNLGMYPDADRCVFL